MKLLVTGAAGMLGSALCPTLREEGHDVSATDVRLSGQGSIISTCATAPRWRGAAATSTGRDHAPCRGDQPGSV